MIIDETGVILIPGNGGKDCPGNGTDPTGACCCDECDYMMCYYTEQDCDVCGDENCPRAGSGHRRNYGAVVVEPPTGRCPPDTCI